MGAPPDIRTQYIRPGIRNIRAEFFQTEGGKWMVRAMTVLLLCQLAGTVVQQALGLPVPGPVLGMVLLLVILAWHGGPSASLDSSANGLLRYFGLLFVPAGVGVVTELQELRANALAIAIAIPVSTFLALAVTGGLMQLLLRGEADAS
jgi:holin-like protein